MGQRAPIQHTTRLAGAGPQKGTDTMRDIQIRTRALAIATAAALLALTLGASAALGSQGPRMAENTFTKWIAGYPNMAGVVGGDVGTGTYAGRIFSRTGSGTVLDPIRITADYHFNGSRHAFTARVDIVEIGTTATIGGTVTDGWLKGYFAAGGFDVISCAHDGTTTTCFQGYLDILRGTTQQGFHLDKTCAEDLTEPLGYVCTVQHSDFAWIPAGTEIHYLSQDGNVVQARIDADGGSAYGACTWASDFDAICIFDSGTGRLSGFNLDVVVSTNADQSIWYWDGTYWFDN